MPQKSPPRGGFTLGLIVGLLIGLAVALAVAMYVTKAPVPFINKVPQRSSTQDEAEIERNRQWDPNGPLAGRTGQRAQPAPPPSTAVVPPPSTLPSSSAPLARASQPARASASAPAAKASAAATKASAPASKASAPARKASDPAAASAPAAAASKPPVYFVQAGAFSGNEEAEAQRARLSMLGLSARIIQRDLGNGRFQYRVRLGPYNERDSAEDIRDQLSSGGVESTLVKIER